MYVSNGGSNRDDMDQESLNTLLQALSQGGESVTVILALYFMFRVTMRSMSACESIQKELHETKRTAIVNSRSDKSE